MSYELALEQAGATVHLFEQFGSYQGDWWARVTYNGKTGWVNGSYGSCSGCDSFQSEFDSGYHTCGGKPYCDPTYDGKFTEGCETCDGLKVRLSEFGKKYLDDMVLTQEQAEARAEKNLEWDMDAQKMVDFIKANKV